MSLAKKLVNALSENKSYVFATSTFIIASTIDCFLTARGIATNQVKEFNPLFDSYIKNFGLYGGILIPKIVLGFIVIVGSKYIDSCYKAGKTKFRVEYILYPSAAFTTAISLSWLVDKYFNELF